MLSSNQQIHFGSRDQNIKKNKMAEKGLIDRIMSHPQVYHALHWDHKGNKFHRGLRDGFYMVIDFPRFVWRSNSSYGALMRYTRQARRNKGKVNPDDFKDVDTNELRVGLEVFSQMKGPLQKIDFRFFYWMYIVMIIYTIATTFKLQGMMDKRIDKTGGSLEERRKMFGEDYEEDVRPK